MWANLAQIPAGPWCFLHGDVAANSPDLLSGAASVKRHVQEAMEHYQLLDTIKGVQITWYSR